MAGLPLHATAQRQNTSELVVKLVNQEFHKGPQRIFRKLENRCMMCYCVFHLIPHYPMTSLWNRTSLTATRLQMLSGQTTSSCALTAASFTCLVPAAMISFVFDMCLEDGGLQATSCNVHRAVSCEEVLSNSEGSPAVCSTTRQHSGRSDDCGAGTWASFKPCCLQRNGMESGWWFGIFFIFPYIGNNHPN